MPKSNSSKNILTRLAGTCLVICLLTGAAACSLIEPKQISIPPASDGTGTGGTGAPYKPAEPQGAAGVLNQARQARAAGDLSRAERLYLNATAMKDLPAADRASAWRELAEVAQANSHPNVALSALGSWQQADAQADNSPAWQSLWFSVVSGLNPGEARTQAQRVYDDTTHGWPARALAGVVLAGRLLNSGLQDNALQVLDNIASNPGIGAQKSQLEHRLFTELQRLNPTQQANLAALVTAENETRFPYSIFLYLVASKQATQAASPEDKASADAVLARLQQRGVLTGPAPESPPTLFAGGGGAASSFGQAQGHGVALLLPLSGSLGNMGMKIAQGARIAQAEASAAGRPFSLTVIDSDIAGWQEEVARLPADVRVVGGPLLPKLYSEIKSRGLTSQKVFFTFLQSIDQGDEGRVAWRFFASPNDQVDALLRFTSELGVSSFASYAPSDSYGSRMSGIFEKGVTQRGMHLSRSGSYPANSPQDWNKDVASFLNTSKNASNAPGSPYKAVFLPDSWKSMEIIIPTMFYYRETRQLLLGTSLWEQGIQASGKIDSRYYELAVFPGAWLGNNQAAARLSTALSASAQTPDLWYAIGYDFARLGAGVAVTTDWNAAQVNAELSKANAFDWSMAPIRWDANGIARQELILFTPVESGFAPVDLEVMRQRFNNAWGAK